LDGLWSIWLYSRSLVHWTSNHAIGGGLRFCLLDTYAKIQRDIVAAWQGMKGKPNRFHSRSAQTFLSIFLLRYVSKERHAFHSSHFLLRRNLLYTISLLTILQGWVLDQLAFLLFSKFICRCVIAGFSCD
jgi:hypothetical protein